MFTSALKAPALNPKTIRASTSWVSMLSILPHLLCCGIPAVAALISLGTTVGLAASLASNPFYQFVDAWHFELVMLAIASVVISGIFNLVAWRIDCREEAKTSLVHGHCAHGNCAPRKNTSLKIFAVSVVLLMLDLAWFATEEKVLGLHHHHEEATVVVNDAHNHVGHSH